MHAAPVMVSHMQGSTLYLYRHLRPSVVKLGATGAIVAPVLLANAYLLSEQIALICRIVRIPCSARWEDHLASSLWSSLANPLHWAFNPWLLVALAAVYPALSMLTLLRRRVPSRRPAQRHLRPSGRTVTPVRSRSVGSYVGRLAESERPSRYAATSTRKPF